MKDFLYGFSLGTHPSWLQFGPFYKLYAAKLQREIIVSVPSREIKWWDCIASQTYHGNIKGVCNGIVVFIPEIAAGGRLASQLLFRLISDLKRRVCVCVHVFVCECVKCLHRSHTCVWLCIYVYVWVKDKCKGAGLSEAEEIRKTYDKLPGWCGGVSWNLHRCVKYLFLFSWQTLWSNRKHQCPSTVC